MNDAKNHPDITTPSLTFLDKMIQKRPGGEERPQQRLMVEHVETCINSQSHSLVQAGTGTGKSFGYLVPSILSSKKITVSTANIGLSEQIIDKDLPALAQEYQDQTGDTLSYTLVKGRSNYLCKHKLGIASRLDEEQAANGTQDSLDLTSEDTPVETVPEPRSELAQEYAAIYEWAEKTEDGDKSKAPVVSPEVWRNVSSTTSECLGRACPLFAECFTELAREKAAASDITVTNHALTAHYLEADEEFFGEQGVIVADEFHGFEQYVREAWGASTSVKELTSLTTFIMRNTRVADTDIREANDKIKAATETLAVSLTDIDMEDETQQALGFNIPRNIAEPLILVRSAAAQVLTIASQQVKRTRQETGKTANNLVRIHNMCADLIDNISLIVTDDNEVVKWVEKTPQDEHDLVLKAQLLSIGKRLMQALDTKELTFIGTSATITVAGSFDIPVRNLALNEPIPTGDDGNTKEFKAHRPYSTIDAGTPFNFPKQGIMYVPAQSDIPAPTGKDRKEHSAAVDEYCQEKVLLTRGKTLILCSTTFGAKRVAKALRENRQIKKLGLPILLQNDAPLPLLIEEFKSDKDSTLIGTLGLWEGLDAPGDTLIHTIIDKIPFGPMNDPLLQARQQRVAEEGGNGFMDVYVADANIKLAQGAGRTIRHTQDRGVVSILDSRMNTKAYGKKMRLSLPSMYFTTNAEQVATSLQNLANR